MLKVVFTILPVMPCCMHTEYAMCQMLTEAQALLHKQQIIGLLDNSPSNMKSFLLWPREDNERESLYSEIAPHDSRKACSPNRD